MDTIKVGNFLKQLRKDSNMTQEQLGEKVGVTNKTVSRWENGNYMPPVECLEILSQIYQISINEILAGERVDGERFTKIAEENLTMTLKEMKRENKKVERSMICTMLLTTILAIGIIILLPMNSIRDFIILGMVVALAFIANTLSLITLVAIVATKDSTPRQD